MASSSFKLNDNVLSRFAQSDIRIHLPVLSFFSVIERIMHPFIKNILIIMLSCVILEIVVQIKPE